jgi:signal transduction histidine kinase
MSPPDTFHLVAAALYLVPALIWFSMAYGHLAYLRNRQPGSPLFRLLPIATSVVGFYFLLDIIWALAPADLHRHPTARLALLEWLTDVVLLASVALFRHFLRFVPVREEPPTRAWLAANYGLAALVALMVAPPRFVNALAESMLLATRVVFLSYVLAMSVLCAWQVWRTARGSGWGPGGVVEVRRPDVIIAVCGPLAACAALVVVLAAGKQWHPSLSTVLLEVVIGVTIAIPILVRMLGEIVHRVLVAVVMIIAIGALLGLHAAILAAAGSAFRPLIDLATVVVLFLVLVTGHAWLRATLARVIFRRSRLRVAELQAFVQQLSPESGVIECCRRAVGQLARVMQLRAAVILLRDGEAVVEGDFALEPLRQVWLRDAATAALPTHGFGTAEIRELPLPLREALIEAKVGLGVFPILSPRARWGHLFISTSRLKATFTEEDAQALEAFAAQLALVLDGAELLQRTIAVERSLAHAEKLAAIGELTARIAHDIRNPVTAARSLAQQLARAPDIAADSEPVCLILAELERVERHVAALLRFARRDEFHFEAVDLSELAGATVDQLRPRLESAGIAVDLDADPGVVVRADREKLRQVLLNLIENAMDALDTAPTPRQISVAVSGVNGSGRVSVRDNGPGVPAEALPRLFEPFFSLKPQGTGLGLAIAKRTVEAHGGQIAATTSPPPGLTLRVDLPIANAE